MNIMLTAKSSQTLLLLLEKGQVHRIFEKDQARLCILDANEKKINFAKKIIKKNASCSGKLSVFYSSEGHIRSGRKVAFIFPGLELIEGFELAELANGFDLVAPQFSNEIVAKEPPLYLYSMYLLGVAIFYNDIFKKLNITCDGYSGYSIGEWSALCANGQVTYKNVMESVERLSHYSKDEFVVKNTCYLSISCNENVLNRILKLNNEIFLSHINGDRHFVICGLKTAINNCIEQCKQLNVLYQRLDIESGYHTPLAETLTPLYQQFFEQLNLLNRDINVYSAITGKQYTVDSDDEIIQHALLNLTETVNFNAVIQKMYKDDFRVFVQLGKGSLPGLVKMILKGQPHTVTTSMTTHETPSEGINNVIATIWVEGGNPDITRLITHTEAEHLAETSQTVTSHSIKQIEYANAYKAVLDDVSNALKVIQPEISGSTINLISTKNKHVANPSLEHKKAIRKTRTNIKNETYSKTITLDLNGQESYLKDHNFLYQPPDWADTENQNVVVPLTMEVELLKAFLEEVTNKVVTQVVNFKAVKWLNVKTTKSITLEMTQTSAQEYHMSILDYCEAKYIVSDEYLKANKSFFSRATKGNEPAQTVSELYDKRVLIHGKKYQAIHSIDGVYDNFITTKLKNSGGKGAILDAMAQSVAYLKLILDPSNAFALPVGFDGLLFYQALKQPEYFCAGTVVSTTKNEIRYNIQLADSAGHLICELEGWTERRFGIGLSTFQALVRPDIFYLSQFVSAKLNILNTPLSNPAVFEFYRKMALNNHEQNQLTQVPPNEVQHWIKSKIAVKDCVKKYLKQFNAEQPIWPVQLEVSGSISGPHSVMFHRSIQELSQHMKSVFIVTKVYESDVYCLLEHSKPIDFDIIKKNEAIKSIKDSDELLIKEIQEEKLNQNKNSQTLMIVAIYLLNKHEVQTIQNMLNYQYIQVESLNSIELTVITQVRKVTVISFDDLIIYWSTLNE